MNWYMQALSKYAVFSGRARRREYWTFVLVNGFILSLVYVIYYFMLFSGSLKWGLVTFIIGIFGLLIIIPSWAVLVRRLHDTGRSGWWIFINFVPLVGSLILLIILLSDSQNGPNQYGPNPKVFGYAPGYPPQYPPPYPPPYAPPPYPPAGYPYPPQAQASAFCPRCGARNVQGAAFCPGCGSRMG
jgi:uncharacterized membrane protein YhaH (DUF805 family)